MPRQKRNPAAAPVKPEPLPSDIPRVNDGRVEDLRGIRDCLECGRSLPATTEHFHKKGVNSRGEVRLDSLCVECRNTKDREKEAAKKAAKRLRHPAPLARLQALLDFLDPDLRAELEAHYRRVFEMELRAALAPVLGG